MRYWNHCELAEVTGLGQARQRLVLALVLCLLPALALAGDLLQQRLAELQEQSKPVLADVRLASPKLLNEAYAARGYAFAWVNPGQVSDLKALAEHSRDFGLRPADFHIPE